MQTELAFRFFLLLWDQFLHQKLFKRFRHQMPFEKTADRYRDRARLFRDDNRDRVRNR